MESENQINEQNNKTESPTNTENKEVVIRGEKNKGMREIDEENTNFQLQDKWVMGMKCTVWGIQSIIM